MSNPLPPDEKETIRDFHHWMVVARSLIHDSFTGDDKELQRLTLQAAQGLMLDHQLGAIKSELAGLKAVLKDKE